MRSMPFRCAALSFSLILLAACASTPTVTSRPVAADAATPPPAAVDPDAPMVTPIAETPAAVATPLPAAAEPLAAAAPAPIIDAEPPAYERAELHGKLHLPPGQTLPQGVRMQLVLIDRFLDDPSHAVIARAEQPVAGPAPIGFTLGYDRALIADPTRYVLDVALRDITGRVLYRSAADHPVNLSPDAEPTRVDLRAAR